jgi:hypothetical protein
MAEVLHTKETLLLLIQYVYELFAFCTSTIAYDSSGLIHHGRNLDFPFPQMMREAAYEAHFIKDKRILYKAVMFGGTNGVSVGQRNGYTISINQRMPSKRTSKTSQFMNMANMFMSNNKPALVIREALENCTNYECAYNVLATSPQIAPSYYAISGNETYQGAIITRDRFSVAHIDTLSKERWYIN